VNRIGILRNPVQAYAWGSMTELQGLLGQTNSQDTPMAELWMGAHPKAPSKVLIDGEWKSLVEVIERDPASVLGKGSAEKFSNRLPFLFKVIAADKPLSIQVHPNREQAQAGFARERSLGVPLDAHNRNYRDVNHKPELLCALTSFKALKGFRNIIDILGLMGKVAPSGLSNELADLRKDPHEYGLKRFFTALIQIDKNRQDLVVSEAMSGAEKWAHEEQAFHWMLELNKEYPGDIGIFSPIMLNLLELEPGEAIYLSAGELHTYLHGVGIELMANSDNVVRGGLTSKHVDVSELLNIVDFKVEPTKRLKPVPWEGSEECYPSPAEEFMLSVISVDSGGPFTSRQGRSVEILICIEGEAVIRDYTSAEVLTLAKGTSIIVPATVSRYVIKGDARLYKASVPSF
jgi:mannose-6-phosphate isomerase